MDASTPHTIQSNATMVDTLKAMRRLALEAQRDLETRRLVERICENVAQGDYASEVLAIYYWVCRNIRYMRDPPGVELVKTPRQLIRTKAGDCDDMATLLAAMLMLAGNTTQFAIAGFSPQPSFSHVYVEVKTPHGMFVVDPVANRDTAKMLRNVKHHKVIPIATGAMDAGVGRVDALVAKDREAPMRHVGPQGGNVFSVFDYGRGLYSYYEGPATQLPATGRFRQPSSTTAFGAAPESFAPALPPGSRLVGEGEEPRGTIAAGATGSLNIPSWLVWFGAGATAAVVVRRVFK